MLIRTSERSRSLSRVLTLLTALGLSAGIPAGAQVIVAPGTTTVIDIGTSGTSCAEADSIGAGVLQPVTDCIADPNQADGLHMRVLAVSGLSQDPNTFFGQTVSSVARLLQPIQVPLSSEAGASPTVPVQIATQIAWSGGMIVAGIDSTFGQIIGTLQVRDVTDADQNNPGPLVASNTFLFERVDADLEIDIPDGPISTFIQFFNLIEIEDLSSSTGADLTVFLKRGRNYVIEVEAKCDVQVPIFGFGACLFSNNVLNLLSLPDSPLFAPIENDGFMVSDITVTVASDPLEGLLSSL